MAPGDCVAATRVSKCPQYPPMWQSTPAMSGQPATRVNLVTLGCARNEVDSSEIAGRLQVGGYQLVADPAAADVVVVNTCAFVASAKKDSIDTVLAAADTGAKVVAVGCLAERYGSELARRCRRPMPSSASTPTRTRPPCSATWSTATNLPRTPRSTAACCCRSHRPPGPTRRRRGVAAGTRPASGPTLLRTLLHSGPVAPLKIASGCDRRCTFCAIPSFRGAFVSRPIAEIVAEAHWLAGRVSGRSCWSARTRPRSARICPASGSWRTCSANSPPCPGSAGSGLSYLQPAETRPWLIEAIADIPGVADYYDMSFQHASEPVLRRMRRYGSRPAFLALIEQIRAAAPEAGIRSNVIVGFPGETEDDLAELEAFLIGARMDAVGVFGYSDEDGTAAADLPGKLDDDVIAERVERVTSLVEELTAQRAEDRIGTEMLVLVDADDEDRSDGATRRPPRSSAGDRTRRPTSTAMSPSPT